MKNLSIVIMLLIGLSSFTACEEDNLPTPTNPTNPTNPGTDANFKIVPNNDGVLPKYTKKVVVFGIDVYAVPAVEDRKLLHAANLFAQYLDNDEDGVIDNQLVMDKMLENKAYMVMWKKQSDLNNSFLNGRVGQDLGNDETHPDFVKNGKTGPFDAALEEVLHLVNNAGHQYAYPSVFGTTKGTEMSNAMDVARGGQFNNPPSNYPAGAWYTYDDPTCDYECQAGEYIYWVTTSILGAQENRLNEIDNEWRLNTKAKVESQDNVAYKLITNPIYKMPTVLPDGSYKN